jgi:DNA polymerase-4
MIASTLYYLVERCCKTMRRQERSASTVTVKVRFTDFTTVQKQSTLAIATANEEDVFAAALRLLGMLLRPGVPIRLVGVKVSHLSGGEDGGAQMVLGVVPAERFAALHRRLDALQAKHGYATIQWGITYALRKTAAANDDGYELHNAVYGM